jgi:hypothetical protein
MHGAILALHHMFHDKIFNKNRNNFTFVELYVSEKWWKGRKRSTALRKGVL